MVEGANRLKSGVIFVIPIYMRAFIFSDEKDSWPS